MVLNKQEAIAALRKGKVIGILGLNGIEIFFSKGNFLFKHRDGEVEMLNKKTMRQKDGYYIMRDLEHADRKFNFKTRKFDLIEG